MEGAGKTENCTIIGTERRPGKTLLIAADFAGYRVCRRLRPPKRKEPRQNVEALIQCTKLLNID